MQFPEKLAKKGSAEKTYFVFVVMKNAEPEVS
jgi:hypothetical protein